MVVGRLKMRMRRRDEARGRMVAAIVRFFRVVNVDVVSGGGDVVDVGGIVDSWIF